MSLNEIEPYLKNGKIGMLPNYKGYFKWSHSLNKIYMQNGDYIKTNLTDEKLRTDFYYII